MYMNSICKSKQSQIMKIIVCMCCLTCHSMSSQTFLYPNYLSKLCCKIHTEQHKHHANECKAVKENYTRSTLSCIFMYVHCSIHFAWIKNVGHPRLSSHANTCKNTCWQWKKMHGNLWKCMEIHWNPKKFMQSMEMHGNLWKSMEINGNPIKFMQSMEIHWNLWKSMEIHWSPIRCM